MYLRTKQRPHEFATTLLCDGCDAGDAHERTTATAATPRARREPIEAALAAIRASATGDTAWAVHLMVFR